MRIRLGSLTRNRSAYTLLIVVVFTSLGLMVLAGALGWSSSNTVLNDRNNNYFATVAAAEAATEKVLAHMLNDFQSQGDSLVFARLNNYQLMVPTTTENPLWTSYQFSDPAGTAGRTQVQRLAGTTYTPLQSRYQGIYGLASTYRVIANARSLTAGSPIDVGVKQEVQLASIPIFQFAIFYAMDLEINPGPNMNITGRVHGNGNIYTQPQNNLTFQSDISACGKIIPDKHPNDPLNRNTNSSTITFQGQHVENAESITLPIGTNNSPDAVAAILDVPPPAESASSQMGKERFYNKADLIVLVSNTTVTVRSGQFNNFATVVPTNEWANFLSTSSTFFNKREGKTVQAVDIDVAQLKLWAESSTAFRTALGRDVRSIYVADMRTSLVANQPGVRVKNGQTLPSLGLTVATPNPLYVQGHFNAPAAHLGTADTSLTKPAALIGDAITILSTAWADLNSTLVLSTRQADNTTVNAALLAGIVPSGNGYYSGGVENFPRFLEHWGGDTLTYNGSMVVMFNSRTATAPWGGVDVYSPPTRNWTFDRNFMDSTKLPPGTPEARVMLRAEWASITSGSTN